MTRRRFWLSLGAFLLPFLALYSVPVAVMVSSGEIRSVDHIAEAHASSAEPNRLYGPAYTNPDKRYKLVSMLKHDAPIDAIGSSRVMQFRAVLFKDGEKAFYNAGGSASRLSHFRRLLAHLPTTASAKHLIIGLDHWWYNDAYEGSQDDPQVEGYYTEQTDALGNLRVGLAAWSDVRSGKVQLGTMLRGSADWGTNALMRGNGWRRDGSYVYADVTRDPKSGPDYQFKDTLERIRQRNRRFEAGPVASEASFVETRRLVEAALARGMDVVLFLPPFAPTVDGVLRTSPNHTYLSGLAAKIRAALEGLPVTLFDFTSCEDLGCSDAEFVDGVHGGDTVYARLASKMAPQVPWLADALDPRVPELITASAGRPNLE